MNINDIIDGAVVSIQAETADFIKTNVRNANQH